MALEINGSEAEAGLHRVAVAGANSAKLGRSHWLSSRMGARPTLLASSHVEDPHQPDLLQFLGDPSEVGAAASQDQGSEDLQARSTEVARSPSVCTHWLSSGMGAPSEIVLPAPQEVLSVIENSFAPRLEVAEPLGEAVAPTVDIPDDIKSERLTLAAAAVVRSPSRRFGVGALAVSAIAGAAASLGLFLTFGLPHGRWERPVGDGVYGEVASSAQSSGPSLSFASAVIDIKSAAVAVPGIFSSEPTEGPAAVGEVVGDGEGEVEQAAFSSLIVGTPFETHDVVVEGLIVASASSVVPADGDLEHVVGGEDETSSPPVSFGSAQLAGALDAPNSSGAGAVLDDGSGVIALPPPMTSGKIVVDRLSTGAGDNATDTVITVPAGARKVDAVLHLVTADGRVAHISDLSVVLGDDETRSGAEQRPARKISPRKSSAADAKKAAAPKPAVAVRSPANRTQTSPPSPPRGLFNFDGYGGVKKANSPDGGKRGAAS